MSSLELRLLTEGDLAGALTLSDAAGWNQLPGDWARLLRCFPEFCLGGFLGGRLVATATLAVYDRRVAWVGMVLVHPDCRGQGFGKTIFDGILALGREHGIPVIGLDATDLGRPVYLKFGFEDLFGIDRWKGVLPVEGNVSVAVVEGGSHLGEVVRRDTETLRVSRETLLCDLAGDPAVDFRVVLRGGRVVGYSFLRPGRGASQLGPIYAESEADFEELLVAAGRRLAGGVVYLDIFRTPENRHLLESRGLEVQRELTRMSLPSVPDLLTGPGMRAIPAFEWG